YSQWKSVKDIEALRRDPDVEPYMRRVADLGTFEAIACEVSYVHHGERGPPTERAHPNARGQTRGSHRGHPRAGAGYRRGGAGSRGRRPGSGGWNRIHLMVEVLGRFSDSAS